MDEELRDLKKLVGGWAFRALQQGRPLQIWRMSSPHNWFIEGSDVRTGFLWHSDDYHRKLPSLDLFRLAKDSDERVPQYWGSDSGMARLSLYVLKEKHRKQ